MGSKLAGLNRIQNPKRDVEQQLSISKFQWSPQTHSTAEDSSDPTEYSSDPTEYNSPAVQVLNKAFTLLLNDTVEYKLFTHTFTKFDKDSVTDVFKILHNHQITQLKDG